jgi:hypothetical protein
MAPACSDAQSKSSANEAEHPFVAVANSPQALDQRQPCVSGTFRSSHARMRTAAAKWIGCKVRRRAEIL